MSRFEAHYYDGQSSERHAVTVHAEADGRLRITGEGVSRMLHVDGARVSDRLGNTRRSVYFVDGSKLETDAHEAVDAWVAPATGRGGGGGLALVHLLESRWRYVAVAAFLTAGVLFGTIEYGVPFAANRIAHTLPASIESHLGEQALAAMDGRFLAPSELPAEEVYYVEKVFDRIRAVAPDARSVRLELRAAPGIGANAFALPAGTVVITDDIVELLDEAPLEAVIAHELGHVAHRHILRSILQNSVTALMLAVVLGDLSSVAGLAGAIPTLLVESHYSRVFELEADAYAAQVMRAAGRSPEALGRALSQLAEAHGQSTDREDSLLDYLSTHPAPAERMKAIEDL